MLRLVGAHELMGNRLLWALSTEERARLRPSMQHVSLTIGQVVYESGESAGYVYFPTTAVVSCLYTMRDGSIAEIALVGNDGVVGVALFLGGGTAPHRAVVQIGGDALKIPANQLRREFGRGGLLHQTLLLYTQALLTQISQTAVCNRLHSIEQRLCRWLLLCHDRVNSAEIQMTQEYIANMLGTRREGVTIAAGRLQNGGLIHYSRGRIKIIDRKGLEGTVCECYRTVKDEVDRLVGPSSKQFISR